MATRKPACLQHAVQDRHGEAGMIDVGVAGDEDDIDVVPAAARPSRAPLIGASGAAIAFYSIMAATFDSSGRLSPFRLLTESAASGILPTILLVRFCFGMVG